MQQEFRSKETCIFKKQKQKQNFSSPIILLHPTCLMNTLPNAKYHCFGASHPFQMQGNEMKFPNIDYALDTK
jgi:hypothetical protein